MAVIAVKSCAVALYDGTVRMADTSGVQQCVCSQHPSHSTAEHSRKRSWLDTPPLASRPRVRPRFDSTFAALQPELSTRTKHGRTHLQSGGRWFSTIRSMRARLSQQWRSTPAIPPSALLSRNACQASAPTPHRSPALPVNNNNHPSQLPSLLHSHQGASPWIPHPAPNGSAGRQPITAPPSFPLLPPPKPLILLPHAASHPTQPRPPTTAAAQPNRPLSPTPPPLPSSCAPTIPLSPHTPAPQRPLRPPPTHPATPRALPPLKLRLPSMCARAWPLSYHRARHATAPKPPPPIDPLPLDLNAPASQVHPSPHVAWKRSRLLMGRFVVRRSGVQGLGVYTRDHLAAGELLMEYTGELVRHPVADRREVQYHGVGLGCYFFALTPDLVIDATHRGGIARFVNHSCEPNCEARIMTVGGSPRVFLFALQPIQPGIELVYDYKLSAATVDHSAALEGLLEGDEGQLVAGTPQAAAAHIPCCCGAANCRGVL